MAEQIGCRKLESSGKQFDHLQLLRRKGDRGYQKQTHSKNGRTV